jgi:hypothetical protein
MSLVGFEKTAPIATLACFSAIVISRAPTLVDELNILGMKLHINVGHVVVFSTPLILLLMTWFWVIRDVSLLEKRPFTNNRWIVSFLVSFPSFAAAFLEK